MPYNFKLLAWLVATLVDRLGYDRFDALSISWGGGRPSSWRSSTHVAADNW